MRAITELKERMSKGLMVKPCPICGAAPVLRKYDLDRGNGHGYPGYYDYQLECSGCGIIEGARTTDLYDDKQKLTAEQRAVQDWNETVDFVNELIDKTRQNKQ